MPSYADKPSDYFGRVRTEIARLIPPHCGRVLDVGCGSGATLRWLKESGRCREAVGIERVTQIAEAARPFVDRVLVGDAPQVLHGDLRDEKFDLVLCLDVMEHMEDPWTFVHDLRFHMEPGAWLVASIPNVRHLSVLLPLVFRGRWRYAEDGILDRTHLRFFTRESARALIDPGDGALTVTRIEPTFVGGRSRSDILNRITGGAFEELLATQYLVAATRTG